MKLHVRKYIYAILIALGPLAVFYGVVSDVEAALWIGVGATVLAVPGSSLALTHLTPDSEEVEPTLGKHGIE